MKPRIVVEPQKVEDELASLGIALVSLTRALQRGLAGYNSCTENDPIQAAGWMQWKDTTRAVREEFIPMHWECINSEGQAITRRPDGKLDMVVASGNPFTGIDGIDQPKTRAQKGPTTINFVQANNQPDLFPHLLPAPKLSLGVQTWMLLFYRDEDFLRAELSLPCAFSESGVVDGWLCRLILPSIPLGGPSLDDLMPRRPWSPDVEVPVKRRA